MAHVRWLLVSTLVAALGQTFWAEPPCPGNVASVPLRYVNRYQMIVAERINHSGPYDFLLDTGTQISMVDPRIAASLHLPEHDAARVASVGMSGSAAFSQVDSVEVGSRSLPDFKVLVYDLRNLQTRGLNIDGVLGEDFLERFDMFIDNGHHLLCLDDSGTMRTAVKGARIPLLRQASPANASLAEPLVVSVRLSDGMRPIRLKLDSGTTASFLYDTSGYMALGLYKGVSLQGGADGNNRTFTSLPLQNLRLGPLELSRVQFVTMLGVHRDPRTSDFDGLLTFGLFRRLFIDHVDHLAVLDPL